MPLSYWYVGMIGGARCCIYQAENIGDVLREAGDDIGKNNIQTVRLATEEEVASYRAMSGGEPAVIEKPPTEGWGWPGLARKAHYFDHGRSLCGAWLYTGRDLGAAGWTGPDDCKKCARLLAQRLAKATAQEGQSDGTGQSSAQDSAQ